MQLACGAMEFLGDRTGKSKSKIWSRWCQTHRDLGGQHGRPPLSARFVLWYSWKGKSSTRWTINPVKLPIKIC